MTTERLFYRLKRVTEFLELDSESFIDAVDETTILKYSKNSGDKTALTMLDIEVTILITIESHRHVISFKSDREDDLLLEQAQHRSMTQFLKTNKSTEQQRIA